MSAASAKSGTNVPPQSGQCRPQPCAEPVVVTVAPITSTRNIPTAVAAASHLTALSRRSDRLTGGRLRQREPSGVHLERTILFCYNENRSFRSETGGPPMIATLETAARPAGAAGVRRWLA